MARNIVWCPKDGCRYKCCDFDQGNYILILPGEVPDGPVAHLEIIEADYFGGMKVVCHAQDKANCDNGYKPIDCELYPFFRDPNRKGGLIRGKKCPILPGDAPDFMDFVQSRLAELERDMVVKEFFKSARMVDYEPVWSPGDQYARQKRLKMWKFEDMGVAKWTWENIGRLVNYENLQVLTMKTVERIKSIVKGKKAFFGYSGGKDSMVLADLCMKAGVNLGQQVLCQPLLEFPVLEDFYAETRPGGVIVERTHQGMLWLQADPARLWPDSPKLKNAWLSPKWKLHEQFALKCAMDVFIVGRRKIDGNMVGKDGITVAKNGLITLNAIHDWDHESIFAYMYYNDIPAPPYFDWPSGFKYGNEPWPNRRWSGDPQNNWKIVCKIDPALARHRRYFLTGEGG